VTSTVNTHGWFKAIRSKEAMELIRANPNAFILAFVIAHRGRYSDSEAFNADNLAVGEALLGDYPNYSMTHKQYRTAVNQLEKWRFAAFRRTNKGTIGKLLDTRLFSISPIPEGKPKGNPRAIKGQPKGNQRATNKISKKEKIREEGGDKGAAPLPASLEREEGEAGALSISDSLSQEAGGMKDWQLDRDIKRFKEEIEGYGVMIKKPSQEEREFTRAKLEVWSAERARRGRQLKAEKAELVKPIEVKPIEDKPIEDKPQGPKLTYEEERALMQKCKQDNGLP
jgi:hypothetical protein